MQPIPEDILLQFNAVLDRKSVPSTLREDYRKWLRYFLDFRSKYVPQGDRSEKVRLFIEKMRSKGASGKDLHYAAHAVSLFFSFETRSSVDPLRSVAKEARQDVLVAEHETDNSGHPLHTHSAGPAVEPVAPDAGAGFVPRPGRKYNEWWSLEHTMSPEWDAVIIDSLAGEIRARHYSRKTLKAYADWSRKFQLYLKHRSPQNLTADDVKAYLTYLAVNCKVSASTQNQAFNA